MLTACGCGLSLKCQACVRDDASPSSPEFGAADGPSLNSALLDEAPFAFLGERRMSERDEAFVDEPRDCVAGARRRTLA